MTKFPRIVVDPGEVTLASIASLVSQALAGEQRLLELREGFQKIGLRTSAGYERIADGRFPTPIKVGRASRVYQHEVDAIAAALAAGVSDEELRRLVARLHDLRAKLCAAWGAAISAAAA